MKNILFPRLYPEAVVDGSSVLPPGLELEVKTVTGDREVRYLAVFHNRGSVARHLDAIRFTARPEPGDFLSFPGREYRIFLEGWTMVTPAKSVRYGEKDNFCNPDYLPAAVSDPVHYNNAAEPNRFSGEYVGLLNHRPSGSILLAGFITSRRMMCRLTIELAESGVAQLELCCDADHILVEPGESVESEELLLTCGSDSQALLEEFASRWGENMNARTWDHAPTGWCSWYYYFENVTAADIAENLEELAARRSDFPLEYIQIDNGWQSAYGDWLHTNARFPEGLRALAHSIAEKRFKPGLWLAPFLVEKNSRLYSEHPEWTIRTPEGETVWLDPWGSTELAVLDGTHPGVQAHFRNLFRQLAELGFEYVKLDFMMYACTPGKGRYFDPKATRLDALRRALTAIREGFGEERFILGCTTVLAGVVGLVNAERISTDITPYWERKAPGRDRYREDCCVPNVCRNIINRTYMHRRLFLCDPDVHIARRDRNELTDAEVRLWTSALLLAGGLKLLADRFPTLEPERAELSRLLLAAPDRFRLRPLDRFDREYPAVWFGIDRESGTPALGIFNFAETSMRLQVTLPDAPAGTLRNLWGNETLKWVSGAPCEFQVEPHNCLLFLLSCSIRNYPTISKVKAEKCLL